MDDKTKNALKTGCITALLFTAMLAVVPVALFLGVFSPPSAPPRNPRAAAYHEFASNQAQLVIVRDYLAGLPYTDLSIHHTAERGTMWRGGVGAIAISDDAVSGAVQALFYNGFRNISRRGNAISFTRWTRRNLGVGITYGMGRGVVGSSCILFLTRLEPMQVGGGERWYYYEADFNVYRLRRE